MPDLAIAPDQAARNRIAEDLDTTLFVEAGAGTGKTTALVDRVLALVIGGHAELEAIAAITFTDKAAAELRARVRRQLEERAIASAGEDARVRCAAALDQLDGAAIGTLHSFAQRLLSEHPVEAGLPPRVEVLDEVSSAVAFERRWRGFRDELLADPGLERSILLLVASGVRDERLARAGRRLRRQLGPGRGTRSPTTRRNPRRCAPWQILPWMPSLTSATSHAGIRRTSCACDSTRSQIGWPGSGASTTSSNCSKRWRTKRPDPASRSVGPAERVNFDTDLSAFRASIRTAGDRLDSVRSAIAEACVERLAVAIRRFTLVSADERRRAGQLEFHDLLVMARGTAARPRTRRRGASPAARPLPAPAPRRVPGHRSHPDRAGRAHRGRRPDR